jgi:hypothetical protein
MGLAGIRRFQYLPAMILEELSVSILFSCYSIVLSGIDVKEVGEDSRRCITGWKHNAVFY